MLAAGADGDAREGVRLHAAGLSLRETEAILHLLGVDRSFQAIFQWVHRLADSVPDPPSA